MGDHLQGVSKPTFVEETVTIPAGAGAVEYALPTDFHTNYIVLDATFLGQTDIPTLAEKLAKLGTFDIKTKNGVGQWITGLDFDDFYYWYQARYLQGQVGAFIGEGGGCNDISNIRVILDAGCKDNISSKCAWSQDSETVLRINYIADGAILDNGELNIRYVGYKGVRPNYTAGIKSLTPTLTSGQEVDIEPQAGDILQEMFAFLTTDLDLATLQATTAPTLEELRIFQGKKFETSFDVFSMVDGIDNSDDANLLQYVWLNLDKQSQGLGYLMEGVPKIQIKAGTAGDAGRFYFKLLEKV